MWSSCAWVSTNASTSSRRSSTWRRSGRIRSTPGSSCVGEQHAAVDDQQPAQMLENGHVAADFADPAQRGDPQTARGQRPRWFEFCVHYRSTAAARISAASASICSGRGRKLRQPRVADLDALQPQPLLGQGDAAQPRLGIAQRPERHVDLARGRDVTRGERRQHVSQLAGGEMAPYADETDGPHRQPRQVQRVVTGVVRQPVSAMICPPPCRSPLASLTATMFGCSASLRMVSHSIGTTDRGGMS